MMLMTKFGKFKLRLIATINLSVLLSLFNIASTTTNYWFKFVDHNTGDSHYGGLYRSCPVNQIGNCVWRNGILQSDRSLWSYIVRFLIMFGSLNNILVVILLILAFLYKLNKKSRQSLRLLEWANFILISSFILIFIGFTVFISNRYNFSLWLHSISMILIMISSNMLTRTFAAIYFQNTRLAHCNKSVDTALSNAKLSGNAEEKVELTKDIVENIIANQDNVIQNIQSIEMSKMNEANRSNEALIPSVTNTQTITINEVNNLNQQEQMNQVNSTA